MRENNFTLLQKALVFAAMGSGFLGGIWLGDVGFKKIEVHTAPTLAFGIISLIVFCMGIRASSKQPENAERFVDMVTVIIGLSLIFFLIGYVMTGRATPKSPYPDDYDRIEYHPDDYLDNRRPR